MISGLRTRTVIGVAAGGLMASAGAALLSTYYAWLALAAVAAVCLALISITYAPLLAVATVPAMWFGERLPFFGGIISISDCVMYLGGLTAVLMIDWRRTRLGSLAVPIIVYAMAGILTVLAAGTVFGLVEWGHRIAMITSALVVGVLLRQSGRLELAIWLFMGVSLLFAVEAIRERAVSPDLPAYPFGIQKNYAGGLLGIAELIVLFWPLSLGSSNRLRWLVAVFIPLAMLAAGSRGAIGSTVAIAAAILGLRARDVRLRTGFLAAAVALVGYTLYAGYQLGNQELAEGLSFRPDAVRLEQLTGAIELWKDSPLLGSGFLAYRSHAGLVDPHNVVALTLEEAGVLGLGALLLLLAGTVRQISRHGNELAVIAIALLGARVTHGLVDVYWVHGTGPMPWFVVGAALAEGPSLGHVVPAVIGARRGTPRPSAVPFARP